MNVFRSLMAAVMVFVASGVSADEVSELKVMIQEMKREYEMKINALEAKIDRMEKSQQASSAQTQQAQSAADERNVEYVGRRHAPAGDGGVLIRDAFGSGSSISLGGYFDMEYHDLDNRDSTFRQHHSNLNVGAQITDRIRFNSEYEFEYGGSDAEAGDGEARVEQAYVDYLINDAVNARAGAVLVPFGRYNLYHDADQQDLTERPIMAKDVIPTTWTEAGAGLFGEFNPVIGSYEDLMISYESYVVNGFDDGFSDTGMGGSRSSLKTDNNNGKALVGRVVLSPQLGHEFGISGYTGAYDREGNRIQGLGLDVFQVFGPLELTGEYAFFDVDEPAGSDAANDFDGAYVQANYHFWFDFLDNTFLGRDFDRPSLTLAARYDWVKISDDGDAGAGDNQERRYTLGLNYRPTDRFVWKLEYHISDTDHEALEFGNNDGFVTSVAVGF